MAQKILVTGATGKVGRALVKRLLEDGVEVKAGTRRPDRAERLFGRGVERVELDYDLTETWDAAVQWADRVFLVPPPFDPHADDRLVPFLDWAVQSGSRHLVLLSAMGIEARERLALRRVEQRIERTGVAHTFLRPNIYMQNFARGFVARAIQDEGVIRLPAGEVAVSFVDSRDVAAVAATVLADDAHFARAYTLTGPAALTHDAVAEIIGRVLGRDVRYEAASEASLRAELDADGWPPEQAEAFAGLMGAIREGRRSAVTDDVEALLGRPPLAFERFAEESADAWS